MLGWVYTNLNTWVRVGCLIMNFTSLFWLNNQLMVLGSKVQILLLLALSKDFGKKIFSLLKVL